MSMSKHLFLTKSRFPSEDSFLKALDLLSRGDYVAVPTETVYGLAADATHKGAVANIYKLKERPAFNPLIAHFYSQAQLAGYVTVSPLAQKLLGLFSPGPLTLVLNKLTTAPVCDLVSAGLETLAVRLPAHPVARRLLHDFGKPLAAPSANPSEKLSPTQARHVKEAFQTSPHPPFILDGGPCEKGLESTILDARFDAPVLLRPGSLSVEEIERVAGVTVHRPVTSETIQAPGQMARHYAPQTPVVLNVRDPDPKDAFLAFGPTDFEGSFYQQLSATRNLEEAAANLFSMLRLLDADQRERIQVAPIPNKGLGVAINDRLQRASFRSE